MDPLIAFHIVLFPGKIGENRIKLALFVKQRQRKLVEQIEFGVGKERKQDSDIQTEKSVTKKEKRKLLSHNCAI